MSKRIEAGEFSEWISDFTLTMKGQSDGNVPCNGCVGCCTSSKFILIRPSDAGALEVIPEQLLFSAPSLPPHHYLLGYYKKGHCPMFKNGSCTIYQYRPETCRQYDCRVLKASDADTRDEGPTISKKVAEWEFSYDKPESKKLQKAVNDAAKFLNENKKLFPDGYVPISSSSLAAVAIRIHPEFVSTQNSNRVNTPLKLVKKIVAKYP